MSDREHELAFERVNQMLDALPTEATLEDLTAAMYVIEHLASVLLRLQAKDDDIIDVEDWH